MSLTGELSDPRSRVSRLMLDRFPEVAAVQKEWRTALAGRPVIRPEGSGVPWGTIGTAFDYRARYYLGITPPEETVAFNGTSLLTRSGLFAWRGGLAVDESQLLLGHIQSVRVSPRDGSREYGGDDGSRVEVTAVQLAASCGGTVRFDGAVRVKSRPRPEDPFWAVLGDLFTRMSERLEEIDPVGRELPQAVETEVCRYSFALALLEETARTGGTRLAGSPLSALGSRPSVEGLLAIADPWVGDLRDLSWGFYRELSPHFGGRTVLNPHPVGGRDIGGADADFLLGECLVEAKTSVSATLRRDWLYQLIGYVLLDYEDDLGIRSVGVYMARQTAFVRWSLEDLFRRLSPVVEVDLPAARSAFRSLLRAEGGSGAAG